MIAAQKTPWFAWLFARHARSRIARTFGRVMVRGATSFAEELARGPVLAVVNHTSWWDPLVVLWLSELVVGADGYAVMDAKNLRRLPFFARVGAFGVDLDDELDGARAVRHAAKLLDRPGHVVWIFPQGEETAAHAPLVLRPGAAAIARVARGARVVAVGIRYVFAGRARPDLWVSIGPADEAVRDVADGVRRQTDALHAELDVVDRALLTRDERAFVCVQDAGSPRDDLATRLLARLLPVRGR